MRSPLARKVVVAVLLVFGCVAGGCAKKGFKIDDPLGSWTDIQPSWSPDGSQLAYVHLAQTEAELALGGSQLWCFSIHDQTRTYCCVGFDPAWSPDGSRIAYVAGDQLCLYKLASGSSTVIATLRDCLSPTWRPDGEWIAVVSSQGDETGARNLWKIRSNGLDPTFIGVRYTGEWLDPAWGPDSVRILHTRCWSGHTGNEVFTMREDGSAPVQITNDGLDTRHPCWSPDGTRIAWVVAGGGSDRMGIWVKNLTTGVTTRVSPIGLDPAWSPDGTTLAFSVLVPRASEFGLRFVNAPR